MIVYGRFRFLCKCEENDHCEPNLEEHGEWRRTKWGDPTNKELIPFSRHQIRTELSTALEAL